MKIRLKETGEWGIQTAAKGFDTYDDLPEKMKHVLSLVLVMFPYGGKYAAGDGSYEKMRDIEKIWGLRELSLNLHTFTYPHVYNLPPDYIVEINTKTVQAWKRAEERGGRAQRN